MTTPEPLDQGLNNLGGPSTPAPASATPSDEWKNRFAGLQRSITDTLAAAGYNRLDAIPRKADVDQLQQQVQALNGLQTSYDTLQAERNALVTERDRLAAEKAASELEARKFRLLTEKAPDLVSFYKWLPTHADETQQVAAFEEFRLTLGQRGSTEASRPQTPNQPASMSPASAPTSSGNLMPQMLDALKKGEMDEYNRLKAEWYKTPVA